MPKRSKLRAAVDRAALWVDQDKRQGGGSIFLVPIHACFTEGFDTQDLKQAKSLARPVAVDPDMQIASAIAFVSRFLCGPLALDAGDTRASFRQSGSCSGGLVYKKWAALHAADLFCFL